MISIALGIAFFISVIIVAPSITNRSLWRRQKDLYHIDDSAELLAEISAEKTGEKPNLHGRTTPSGEYVPDKNDPLIPTIILGDGFVDAQSSVPRPLHHDDAKPFVIPEDSVR